MSGATSEVLRLHSRELKMPSVLRSFEGLARQATEGGWAFEDYLAEVLAAEVQSRRESAVRQRLHDARFPELKPLDTFDLTASEGVDARVVAQLARGEWVTKAENVVLAGPIGTVVSRVFRTLGCEPVPRAGALMRSASSSVSPP